MTLKELLNVTSINNYVRISIERGYNDELILIFKGYAEDAIKYFKGVDKTMNSEVTFITANKDPNTNAPTMNIVIR